MFFIRGDANRDGRLTISDVRPILRHLYEGAPLPCEDAADVDDDGDITTADVAGLLQFLFVGGSEPPAPYPQEGEDATATDPLGCGS